MRTRSIRRGSMTISFAPSRSRFFMREANTGCASVGLAPRTIITSVCSTESKSCVPADVPNVVLKPQPVGEWQTRAQVSTLLFPKPPGEAAFDARVAAVRLAVLVRHHANHLVAAHFGLERATNA